MTSQKVFDESTWASSSAYALLGFLQGTLTIGQYAILFRIVAAELVSNNEALTATSWQGLEDHIKYELSDWEIPCNKDDLISLAIHIDIHFQEQTQESLTSAKLSGLV